MEWVPHLFLLGRAHQKLANFLKKGSKVKLLALHYQVTAALEIHAKPDEPSSPQRARNRQIIEREEEGEEGVFLEGPPAPNPEAIAAIPPAWLLVERILDVKFWKPPRKPRRTRRHQLIASDSEVSDREATDDENVAARNALVDGEEPRSSLTETYIERKRRLREVTVGDITDVVWAYIKWQDLSYSDGECLSNSLTFAFLTLDGSNLGLTPKG